MKSFKISLLIISAQLFSAGFIFAGTVPPDSTIFPGLKGQPLMDSLYKYYRASSNLGYDLARDKMYGEIDILSDSIVCVYGGFTMHGGPTADPTAWAYNNDLGINCEHTWPQSSFNEAALPRGDLHHLFPTEIRVNGDRGTLPFGDITDGQTTQWYRNKIILTSIPSSAIDEYSERLVNVKFETKEKHKGNTARAVFYFYNIYRPDYPAIETWWTGQLSYINDLIQWHIVDPADAREIARTKKIATYQQNKVNPFVLDSTLIRRAYFPALGVTGKPQINIADRNKLYQNNPNPFRDKTVISYSLSSLGLARLEIYNLLGQAVRMIEVNQPASGRYNLEWNGADQAGRMLPPGVYFYRLSVNDKTIDLKRMIMLK